MAVADVSFARVVPFLTAERAAVVLGVDQANPAGVVVEADPGHRTVGMHGQYWYRGDYSFAEHPGGTLVTYRITNISGQPDALIKVWQRKVLRRQQQDVEAFAAALPEPNQLGWSVR
ncbi:hypothetical protein EV138_4105 [Kribbella voronezhensis]|uniref:Polyketide cyclase/dehydrase/lipid transport protein n=1 Tax=Kribbella voronezhensis TaxID=2512212 RepID=A0A4R7TED2_9ACTN|nr:hypothetical protein EV138_4105 [Kribbella voronezhensis]